MADTDNRLARLLSGAYGDNSLSTANVLGQMPPPNPLDDATGYLRHYMRRPDNPNPPTQQQWNALQPPERSEPNVIQKGLGQLLSRIPPEVAFAANFVAPIVRLPVPRPSSSSLIRRLEDLPSTSTWYHGSRDPNLTAFSPDVAGGARNTGGRGAVFMTPDRAEAAGAYGPHAYSVESAHQRPFVWEISNMRDTAQRARQVHPELKTHGDGWADQGSFFDALRRAGFDAIETRSGGAPVELGVLDPRLLTIKR